MIIRLHVDRPLHEDAVAALTADQAHYLRNVMRRKEGDQLQLFNARDGEFLARLTVLGKKAGQALVCEQIRTAEPGPDLWLLFAPVKRGPVELIAQKATELGVSVLTPVLTDRGNVARINNERLVSIVTEAAEQCERLSVPAVNEVTKLDTALRDWPQGRSLIFCDEAGDDVDVQWGGVEGRAKPMLEALKGQKVAAKKAAILIGPEGGFSPDERAALRALPFVIPVTLGPRILRADTAAIAAITLWQAACGDFQKR